MQINAFTSTGIWNATVRTLTGMGTTTLLITTGSQTTLAAGSNVDLRPGTGGRIGEDTLAVQTGGAATGTMAIQLTDGVHFQNLAVTAAAANATAGFTSAQNSVVGVRLINNDGAVAGLYMTCGWRLVQ